MLGISMRLGWLVRTGQLYDALSNWMGLVAPHPPGAYLPAALLYALTGPMSWAYLIVGLFWVALLWDGMVRLLTAQGYAASQAWVLAVGLAATPLVWHQVDNFGVDLACAAVTVQALSWLVASRMLRDRRGAVMAGAWVGAGFWVKYTFPIFLFVPCALVLGAVLVGAVRRVPDWWEQVNNGLLLTGATVLTLGPLALLNGSNIVSYVFHSAAPADSEIVGNLGSSFGPGVSAFDQGAFYLAVLRDLWGWPGLVMLGVGLVLVAWRTPRCWEAALALSTVVGALLVLTELDIKADRYITPMLAPLLCVALPPLAAGWLSALLPLGVLAAPVLFLWRDYSGWTHGLPLAEVTAFSVVDSSRRYAPTGRDFEHLASKQLRTWGAWPRVEEPFRPFTTALDQWRVDEVLEAMHARKGTRDGMVGLCLTEVHGTPGFGVFLMAAERMGLHWDLVTVMVLRGQEADGTPRTFQFVGPFKQGEDEHVELDVMYFSYRSGGGNPQLRYLQTLETRNTETFSLPGGMEGAVVEVIHP
jgi:hypothetical protein